MKNFLKSDYFKILLLALLVRVLIMPFYYHPDIKTYYFQASFLKEGVVNIYSYLESNKSKLPLKEDFVYFPLSYYFLGSYEMLASPFLGSGFKDWLYDANATSMEKVGVFRYLFILKIPYLILDIIIAFLLMSFFSNQEQKKKIFSLWLFNPISLAIIYIYSNLDIISVTLTLVSLMLLQKKHLVLSALCLGLGAGFKAYPLIFLPILILHAEDLKEKIKVVLVSLGTILVIIAPFLFSPSFKQQTLLSGLTTRMLLPTINLGFGETILIAIMPLALLFFYTLLRNNLVKKEPTYYFLIILILLFSFIHFHIQWILWVMPFLLLTLVKKSQLSKFMWFLLVAAFLIPIFYNDSSMSVSALRPISTWFVLVPIPYKIVGFIYDPFIVQSLLHTFFASAALIITWALLKEESKWID